MIGPIDLIPKWPSFKYSFLFIQISPWWCLVLELKIQKDILPWTRHQGLISIKTKEYLNGGHFGIRCIMPDLSHRCKICYLTSPWGEAEWAIDLWAKGLIVLVSPNLSDGKGNIKVSKCKLKVGNIYLGIKRKKVLCLSLLEDYY